MKMMKCQSQMYSTRSCCSSCVRNHQIFDQNSHQRSLNLWCCFRCYMNQPQRIWRKKCHLKNPPPKWKKPVENWDDFDISLHCSDNLIDLFCSNHMDPWSGILTLMMDSLVFLDHEVPWSSLSTSGPVENTYGNIAKLQVYK